VGEPHPDDRGPAVRYHLGDHAGSSSVVLDEDGRFVNREEYSPYGETTFGSFARKRYRYTGKERDAESGLSYHGARYYAPWLGRWVSPDPVRLDGGDGRGPPVPVDGPNPYWYARANPVAMVDPTGRQAAPAPVNPVELIGGAVSALQRAAARWGVAELVPGGATAATPIAAGVAEIAGVAPVLATGSAILLTGAYSLHRQSNIAQYGTPYGPEPGLPLLRHARALRQLPRPTPAPDPGPEDERTPQRREDINLDTSTMIGMSSLKDPWLTVGINAFLLDKHLVATRAAITEFSTRNIKHAGPTEKVLAALVLWRVDPIADDPSARVAALRGTSTNSRRALDSPVDRIIFGTGDKLGIRTATSDRRFVSWARRKGVVLQVWLHPKVQFARQ
jgi:RHS repeat-associated protein